MIIAGVCQRDSQTHMPPSPRREPTCGLQWPQAGTCIEVPKRQWFKAFEDRLDSKKEYLFEKVTTKIKEQEERIQNLDFEVEKIHKEVDEVKKENEWLTSKLDDLEN